MVRITELLIRKRAEHNECLISTLEEVSLHQQDIERIENIDKWCRKLRILYLQSNLIPKIENVSKLKMLEYLNLALNNVERIENLEGCESLKKLDLTVNFIGELTSIESLRNHIYLRELFLTGNPCTDYDGYRDYVIATLPRLQSLDGTEVEKSERISAVQNLDSLRQSILRQEKNYRLKRQREKEESERKKQSQSEKQPGFDSRWYTDMNKEDTQPEQQDAETESHEEKQKRFWEEKTAYTPESRIEVHEHLNELKKKDETEDESEKAPPRRLQTEDGRMLNVNHAKVDFTLDDRPDSFVLDVAVFRHMDTSLCDVDIQPDHVKVTLKGKVLQLVLAEEVRPDSSTAQRSQTTGHLVITMPKVSPIIEAPKPAKPTKQVPRTADKKSDATGDGEQYLEVDRSVARTVRLDLKDDVRTPQGHVTGTQQPVERQNSADFVDDPDVPPLM